jgi:hypothetical protein
MTERTYSTERIAPNRDGAKIGDTYVVTTEAHDITLRVRPTGPQTRGYIIAFVSAEPPITESTHYESEVIVKDHEVTVGERFELSTLFPILTQTAFQAMKINAVPNSTEVASASASQQ